MAFPARDQAAEVVEPGEKPFHLPAPPVTAQRPAVLGFASSPPIRRDQLDAVFGRELGIERVRVVRLVPDQPLRKLVEEARAEHPFNKPALRRASAFNRYGER